MNGRVADRQAVVGVVHRFSAQPDLIIDCVVDTGFTGYLTLPASAVQALRLPFVRRIVAGLADGSRIRLSVHLATIVWDGEMRQVEVLATGTQPLLGTLLLDGYELTVQFSEGGDVSIVRLDTSA